jgi:hypothetical protein
LNTDIAISVFVRLLLAGQISIGEGTRSFHGVLDPIEVMRDLSVDPWRAGVTTPVAVGNYPDLDAF